MTLLHTGATKKYSDNWNQAFGAQPAKPAPAKQAAKPKAKPKAKPAKKKSAKGKK